MQLCKRSPWRVVHPKNPNRFILEASSCVCPSTAFLWERQHHPTRRVTLATGDQQPQSPRRMLHRKRAIHSPLSMARDEEGRNSQQTLQEVEPFGRQSSARPPSPCSASSCCSSLYPPLSLAFSGMAPREKTGSGAGISDARHHSYGGFGTVTVGLYTPVVMGGIWC